ARVEHAYGHTSCGPVEMQAEETKGVPTVAGDDRLDIRLPISDRRMRMTARARPTLAPGHAPVLEHDRAVVRARLVVFDHFCFAMLVSRMEAIPLTGIPTQSGRFAAS